MSETVPPGADDVDSFHVALPDRELVVAALDADSAEHGLHRVPPDTLLPFGRWFSGEEDPSVRRYLVGPPSGRWTSVLTSCIDWEMEWGPRISLRLRRPAVYVMLHDGDVFTLHVISGATVSVYASSTDHFDLPPRPPGDLGMDVDVILPLCEPGTTRGDLRAALAPPGRLDVDGALAFERTSRLLGLPPRAAASYRTALEDDGRTVRPGFADYAHVAYRSSLGDAADGDGSGAEAPAHDPNVLRFRPRR